MTKPKSSIVDSEIVDSEIMHCRLRDRFAKDLVDEITATVHQLDIDSMIKILEERSFEISIANL